MRLFRPWFLMRCLYPGAVFRIKTPLKILFLTFDDGPDPVSTPAILNFLEKHRIKAVFFCNGLKAERYPELMESIAKAGHITGNHSYSHSDGWRTSPDDYIHDVSRADDHTSADLFRPPYGHLKPSQFRILRMKYRIVFWDLMPYDFDVKFPAEKILARLGRKMRRGSIIVMHDTQISRVQAVLEKYVKYAMEKGYTFQLLTRYL